MTLEARLDAVGGRPSGFDYMRLILAIGVIWFHTVRATSGMAADAALWHSPASLPLKLIVPIFFALSGFLVAGSLERCKTLFFFLGLRGIRIYPALMVEVVLSAFILGPLLTSFGASDYFSQPEFRAYLLNMLGIIHYYLPGVFLTNPDPGVVNAQLWTIPYELECYAAIAALWLIGVKRFRSVALLVALAWNILIPVREYINHGYFENPALNHVSGRMVLAAFLFGVTLYLYRNKVAWSMPLFVAAVAFILGAFLFTDVGSVLTPAPIAYVTVYLGLLSPRRLALIRGADYSYGIYLYGYPIQQAYASLGGPIQIWYLNGLVCTIVAAGFAAFSWHCIEKPALGFRPLLKRGEAFLISRLTGVRLPWRAAN